MKLRSRFDNRHVKYKMDWDNTSEELSVNSDSFVSSSSSSSDESLELTSSPSINEKNILNKRDKDNLNEMMDDSDDKSIKKSNFDEIVKEIETDAEKGKPYNVPSDNEKENKTEKSYVSISTSDEKDQNFKHDSSVNKNIGIVFNKNESLQECKSSSCSSTSSSDDSENNETPDGLTSEIEILKKSTKKEETISPKPPSLTESDISAILNDTSDEEKCTKKTNPIKSEETDSKQPPVYLKLRKDLFYDKKEQETQNNPVEEILEISSDSDPIMEKTAEKTKKRSLKAKEHVDKSSDSDDFTKKKTKKKEKTIKKKVVSKLIDSDTTSEDEKNDNKSHNTKTSSDSSTESEEFEKQNNQSKKNRKKIKRKRSSSTSGHSSADQNQKKKKSRIRKRIKQVKESSSDEDCDKVTRKKLRKVLTKDSLEESTLVAEEEEKNRKDRILERQKKYNQIFDSEKLKKAHVEKLVLDFDDQSKKELLSVDETLVKKLKPHQAEGIKFMWDSCFESLERIKKGEGSGCILAHCMGLGKTLQVITLTHTLLCHSKKTKVNKVLVVCPLSTVLNWVDEFEKWLDDVEGSIEIFDIVKAKSNVDRECIIRNWSEDGGVMVMGYNMFRLLTNDTNKKVPKRLKKIYQTAFIDPGPDLVVCDEGHLLKNEKTNLSIAMNKIKSSRRIVLTGTPMQNNLKEYYCMVQFVKPNLLGTYKEYLNRFVNPITNGQYTDSTPLDISIMRRRSHVLHSLLDGVIQRKDYGVLAPFLPPKHEYIMFITLSDVQIELYDYYLKNKTNANFEGNQRNGSVLFTDFQELQRICTHPRVLMDKSIEDRNKKIFLDDESSEGSLKDFIDNSDSDSSDTRKKKNKNKNIKKQVEVINLDDENDETIVKSKKHKRREINSDRDESSSSNDEANLAYRRVTRGSVATGLMKAPEDDDRKESFSDEWWHKLIDQEDLNDIKLGSKLFLLFTIIQQCEQIGDKILIFSQSLYSLNIIEYFLAQIDEATQRNKKFCGFNGSWSLGLDYFRIDGSSSCDNRQACCNNFNDLNNTRARLFLISTRAGGLGINLYAANRVIIFDVSWNPSHDTQSIYRVYRFGQTKPCFIYRFVCQGTMEMKVYERQVAKQAISKRVVDEQQIDRHYTQNDLAELYKFCPKPSDERPIPLVPKDVLLGELLQNQSNIIYQYHDHQSLLENKEDEELNEEERKAAWEEFKNEKIMRQNQQQQQFINHIPISSINMGAAMLVKKENPTWTDLQIHNVLPNIMKELREQMATGNSFLFMRIINELRSYQIQREFEQQQRAQQMLLQNNSNATWLAQQLAQRFNTQQFQPVVSNPDQVIELND